MRAKNVTIVDARRHLQRTGALLLFVGGVAFASITGCGKGGADSASGGAAAVEKTQTGTSSGSQPNVNAPSGSAVGPLTGDGVMATVKKLKLPSCLGEPEKFLACPKGTELWGLDSEIGCKTSRSGVQRGDFPRREGPSLWLDSDHPGVVTAAKSFVKHKKEGRDFGFYPNGSLKYIHDWKNDDYHGMYLECYPNGKPSDLQFRVDGKLQGIVRHWKETGELSSGAEYVNDKTTKYLSDFSEEERKKLAEVSDDLCKPKVCDLAAPPQFK